MRYNNLLENGQKLTLIYDVTDGTIPTVDSYMEDSDILIELRDIVTIIKKEDINLKVKLDIVTNINTRQVGVYAKQISLSDAKTNEAIDSDIFYNGDFNETIKLYLTKNVQLIATYNNRNHNISFAEIKIKPE